MDRDVVLPLLADAVLVLHVAIVLFVVGGLLAVVAGNLASPRWRWVNAPCFRGLHAAAIAVVAAQAWFGVLCPLTTLEMWLRRLAHQPTYDGSFVAHWLHAFLYVDAPAWVFILGYSLFGAGVAAVWLRFPPTRRGAPAATPASAAPGTRRTGVSPARSGP